jgi:excisionase family DNA binding protein
MSERKVEAEFVSVRWLAQWWGVSTRTIWRDIRKGALRVHRLPGGTVRVSRAEAIAYGKPSE